MSGNSLNYSMTGFSEGDYSVNDNGHMERVGMGGKLGGSMVVTHTSNRQFHCRFRLVPHVNDSI